MTRAAREPLILALLAVLALVWSGWEPRDRLTWLLEVFPVIGGLIILTATWRRLRLTQLLYRLLFVHALILIVGGHYTYAEVPLGRWLADLLGLARNHYDRLGHFAQGFVPAMLVRELLLRTSPLRPGKWLTTLTLCAALAVSAAYELLEWAAALALGQSAAAFLGTQGDVWDTQWDMFLALCGAATALLTLSRLHDRALRRMATASEPRQAARTP